MVRRPQRKGKHRVLGMAFILVSLAFATLLRNNLWKDDYTIWSDAARKNPSSYRAQVEMGIALTRAGEYTGAIPYLKKAISLSPAREEGYFNMGLTLAFLGRDKEAIGYLEKVIRLNPGSFKAYNSLAIRYAMSGGYEEALGFIRKGIEIEPGYPLFYNTLGNILYDGFNKKEEAEKAYRKAISLDPDLDLPKKNLERMKK